MAFASLSKAGVWGAQPVLGVMGDYYTNPGLIDVPNTAESQGILLLDAPTTYAGDAYKFTVLPSFRYSSAQGYSNQDSNYAHLSLINEFDTERGSVRVTGAVAQDSSLYYDYLLNGSTGVRHNSVVGDVNWDRHLTERVDLDTDAYWTRVLYGQAVGVATLTDNKYESISPTLSWAQSERGKLTAAANVGRYNALDGTTESTSANLQLGFSQKLSEIWSLTANAGYSRADNRENGSREVFEFTPSGPAFVLVPFTLKTSQNGSVYNVTLNRQTSVLTLSAIASRQLVPSGFAFLTRQEMYQVGATYKATARWTLSGDVHRINYVQPATVGAGNVNLNITFVDLSAAWQWTEHWTVTIAGTRVMEHYVSSTYDVASTGVSIEISRQFDWKSIQ